MRLEGGARVELAIPPICFIFAVQQPGSSNPLVEALVRRGHEYVHAGLP